MIKSKIIKLTLLLLLLLVLYPLNLRAQLSSNEPPPGITSSEDQKNFVYVLGEVPKPGKIEIKGDSISVKEALLEAGFFLNRGVIARCTLTTISENGQQKEVLVNLGNPLYEGELNENLIMKKGDTVNISGSIKQENIMYDKNLDPVQKIFRGEREL